MAYETVAPPAARIYQRRVPNPARPPAPQTMPPAPPPAATPARPRPIPIGLRAFRVAFVGLFAGGMIAALLLRAGISAPELPAAAPADYMLLARASGFAAYLLLWAAMIVGIAIRHRPARVWPRGSSAINLHRHAGLLGLGLALLHVLALLGAAKGYTLANALLPFSGSGYRALWIGLLGKLGLYLMALVALSFFVRARLGQRAWRAIHQLGFAVFVLALAHGLFAGTDTPALWARGAYLASAAILLGFAGYRVRKGLRQRATRRRRPVRMRRARRQLVS